VSHLEELGQLRDAAGDRDLLPGRQPGEAATVPPLVRAGQRVEDLLVEAQLLAERSEP
jgi:hypothetical protein